MVRTKRRKARDRILLGGGFYTIKDIEMLISVQRTIVGAEVVGKWVAISLDNGMVIKIKNF